MRQLLGVRNEIHTHLLSQVRGHKQQKIKRITIGRGGQHGQRINLKPQSITRRPPLRLLRGGTQRVIVEQMPYQNHHTEYNYT